MSSRAGSPEHTLIMKAPGFTKAGRVWKPFKTSHLEKISKKHTTLVRNLEWVLPSVRTTGEVSQAVRKRLHDMLDENVSLHAEYVHMVPFARLRRYVGEPTFLAVLAPSPHKTRGLVEVELGLAHRAIDLLLGGTGDAIAVRPLTDIEEGVMTYVIIEAMKVLAPALDPTLPVLRIEGMVRSFDEVQSLIGEDDVVAVVELRAVFGSHTGYVRLFIPEVILAASNPPADAPVRRERRRADAELNAQRLRNVRSELRVEIGQVEISSGDLAQLEERDVILVEDVTCRPDQGQGGTAKLRLGQARLGHFDAAIEVAGGLFSAKVTGVTLGPPPPPAAELSEAVAIPPSLGEGVEESTNPGMKGSAHVENGEAQGADLMNDIPLQIAIELARLPVTAEEVVGLKVGHVFDLNRSAQEPVDLSVNGRVVARGELVEVDGNLGIRIISLAG